MGVGEREEKIDKIYKHHQITLLYSIIISIYQRRNLLKKLLYIYVYIYKHDIIIFNVGNNNKKNL